MYPERPTQLDAALLYYDYDKFAYATLVERMQNVFGEKIPVKLGVHEDGSFAVITVGPVVLKVSQNDGALGPVGFKATLMSPFTQHTKPDAANIVHNHRKNIFVTVGGDDILMPDFAPGEIAPEMQELLNQVRQPAVKPSEILHANRIFVAQKTINILSDMNKPELIHWLQSDQLLTARDMLPENDPGSMALQIHPVMYSTGNDSRGKQKVGFDAFGAEHVMGYHVIVDETALLFEDVFKATQGFVHAVHKSGNVPASGKTVSLKSGAKFRVHHMDPNDKFPRPHLRLEVLELGTTSAQSNVIKSGKKRTGGLAKIFGFATSAIKTTRTMFLVLVVALSLGKMLGGSDGMQIVSLLGN